MFIPNAILILAACVAAVYLNFTAAPVSWRRSIVKTVPVAMFAIVAYLQFSPVLLAVALGLSAIGDFALSRSGRKWFLAGMFAFGLAHLGFVGVMLEHGADLATANWVLVAAILAIVASTEIWLRPHTGALKWPVRGYVLIILAMALSAAGLPETGWLAFYGALVFVFSDLVLALEMFVLPGDHKMAKLARKTVWISYISAQIMLLWGLGVL